MMKRVLIFGGTTEGRLLCEVMAGWPVSIMVCVATEHGRERLVGLPASIMVHTGRMDFPAMEALMCTGFDWVVDATHPYAAVATQTIREAARKVGLAYYRLMRPESMRQPVLCVGSVQEAAMQLKNTEGNILATTGAKELDAYTAIGAYAARVYTRVLPTVESIARCEALGFPMSHIIAMQGPFSQALNEALIQQFDIHWLVTKDGGDFGGFLDKVEAADRCGISCVVIGRPSGDAGYSLEEILDTLKEQI